MSYLEKQIKAIGEAWEESKKTNDKILSGQAKGIAELKEKQEKIDEALNEALEMKKTIEQTEAAIKRMSENLETASKKSGIDLDVAGSALKKALKCGYKLDRAGFTEQEKKAMSSLSDPEGGYTITPFLGNVSNILFDTSPIRALASVQTIGTNLYQGFFDDDEAGAGWVGEGASRTESATPDLGQLNIPIRGMYAFPKVTEELLEDSNWNIAMWLQQKVAEKFGRLEATGFVSGAGVTQPQGIITATAKTTSPAVYARNQVGTKVTAGATAITSDEIVDLRALLKPGYRGNAYFGYNRATEGYIRKLKDGQGNYLWQPSYQANEPDMLNGQRTVICEDMPDIATGAISVVLADFRASYLIVDRVGISILEDRYTEKGKIGYYIRKRVGGAIQNFDSIKYLKQA